MFQTLATVNHPSDFERSMPLMVLSSKLLKGLSLLIGLVLLSACGEQALEKTPAEANVSGKSISTETTYGRNALFSYPEFSGNYSVGTQSFVLTDPSRQETYSDNTVEKRKLQVRLFYPTDKSNEKQGFNKLPVISEQAWSYLIGHQQIAGKKLRYNNYQNASWNIHQDEELSSAQASFPVLVFSHGYGYSAESYVALSGELASKGYIVISINHTFGANPTDINNNEFIWAKPLNLENLSEHLPTWSNDQLFVIEQFIQINNDSDSHLFQRLDLANLGIFGHSYGGAAAFHSAANEPRIQAVIDIDGTIFDFETTQITQPFAFFLSQNHQPKFNFSHAGNDAYLVEFSELTHASFTDHVLWWQWDHDEYDLNFGEVDALRSTELTAELVDDFFASKLLNKSPVWFSNTGSINLDVKITKIEESI